VTEFIQQDQVLATWSSLLTTETGNKADLSRWPTKSIQVSGNAGTGGSINVQGSNDGTTWATLDESPGDGLGTMAIGIKDILQNTRYVRPVVVSGDEATNFKVQILATM